MRKEPKEHLDRDSLLLFRTLCATHNLQRAASQLGMPQATASRSLTKLREAFEDELFTRCSGGLTPTPKALALEPKVAAVIASFEDLFVEETFDPASLVREFRIACADHAMFYIEPAVTLASRMAPGVTFRLSPNGDDWLVELQRGDLDFAIARPKVAHACRSRRAGACSSCEAIIRWPEGSTRRAHSRSKSALRTDTWKSARGRNGCSRRWTRRFPRPGSQGRVR